VLAIDTNPDFGTLSKLAPDAYRSQHQLTDVIAQMDNIRSAPELDPYMSTTPTGLHLLAAPQRPDAMEEMTPEMYGRLLAFLGRFYHVILLDLGTGLTEPLARSRSSAPTMRWSSTPPTGSPRAPCSTRSTTCCCGSAATS
jgi:MinD-like ATPase involved in chromosome partitioning or flagellar assembly